MDEERRREKAETEKEFKIIFNEYSTLVDRLLASHMEDLGISLQQFEEACKNAKGNLAPKFHRTLFEQIWAANDYDIFKALMIKRNLEIHIQAMNVLAQSLSQTNLPSESSNNDDDDNGDDNTLRYLIDDDALMEEVIKLSLQQTQNEQSMMDSKTRDEVVSFALDERNRLQSEKKKEEEKLDKALQKAMGKAQPEVEMQNRKENYDATPEESGKMEELDKIGELKDDKSCQQDRQAQASGVDEVESKNGKIKTISENKIKERQEYLRKRRDEIIETKKKERQKQVKKLEENELKSKRPKSAKAIRSVINEDDNENDQTERLGFRRSLAARLKAEVINK